MNRHQLIDRLVQLTGITDVSVAMRLLRVSIAALAPCLPAPERERWAKHLPAELHDAFVSTPYDANQTLTDVYAAVIHAESAGLERFGVEHAQAAIRALASCLPDEDAAILARYLPAELALLLADPTRLHGALSAANMHARAARPEGHISGAAGGSTHPVSEAGAGAPQPGSVGDWSLRRTEHTLGAGAEPQPDDTLAVGHAGTKRSLSDAKP